MPAGEREDQRPDHDRQADRDDDLDGDSYFFVNFGTVLAIDSSAQSMSSSEAA